MDNPLKVRLVCNYTYHKAYAILQRETIPYTEEPPDHLPKEYGAYHQMYRIDGALVAMSVIDILPSCVSSVYFMYDKNWERFSLGKVRLASLQYPRMCAHNLG